MLLLIYVFILIFFCHEVGAEVGGVACDYCSNRKFTSDSNFLMESLVSTSIIKKTNNPIF